MHIWEPLFTMPLWEDGLVGVGLGMFWGSGYIIGHWRGRRDETAAQVARELIRDITDKFLLQLERQQVEKHIDQTWGQPTPVPNPPKETLL